MPPIIKKSNGLAVALKSKGAKMPPKRQRPLWAGPNGEGPMGGITQGLIGRFLCCRERFRLKVIEGLEPVGKYDHKTGYGNMWHVCEEVFAVNGNWEAALLAHTRELGAKYRAPDDKSSIEKFYYLCKTQFPIYQEFWKKHPDVKQREPLLQEYMFDVPYTLPSGRVLRLRGKWDGVDLIGPKKTAGLYLNEHKTKGDPKPTQLQRQLLFDLQTGFYFTSLWYTRNGVDKLPKELSFLADLSVPLNGVRYNVIRRPLSGGKHSIRQHQPTKKKPGGETKDEFFKRLQELIKSEPEHYFHRWKSEVSGEDVQRYRQRFLDPVGEQIMDWWEYMGTCGYDPWKTPKGADSLGGSRAGIHWQHPFGIWNSVNEMGYSDLDEHIENGSIIGLHQSTNLFPELT